MKKFFTLIAVALVAISASAQESEMKEYITNGSIKYNIKAKTDLSQYPAAQLVNFVSNDYPNGSEGEKVATGTARVVVDPLDASNFDTDTGEGNNLLNYCLAVTSHNNPANNYDSQLFITLPDRTLSAGDAFEFSMKVKADKPTEKGSTQAHTSPGAYKHWSMVGDIPFTTSWETFSYKGTVPAEADGMYTIAINLNDFAEENTYYFDDISWKIEAPKVYNWYTIFENDGTDASSFSVKYFKNYTDAAQSKDGAIVVTSLEPDKTYAEYYMEDGDGNAVDAVLANDWDTQFLINLPVTLTKGQKFNVSFKYWADKEAKTNTQAHLVAPVPGTVESKGLGQYPAYGGTYLHYQLAGDVTFKTTPETFEKTITVPDAADGMGAICFNLNVLRESINYYFDDIVVQIEEESVPTGISTFKAEKATKAIYNVAGQQIKDLQKGLNIVDGKKVYVK